MLAWKLGSKGLVVDEVTVPGSVIGGSSGVYRKEGGEGNSKYKAYNANIDA